MTAESDGPWAVVHVRCDRGQCGVTVVAFRQSLDAALEAHARWHNDRPEGGA